MNEREQLQELNLALEGAVEQLSRAHGLAAGTAPAPELLALERLLGELSVLRNQVRERLMKVLSKPSPPAMTILK